MVYNAIAGNATFSLTHPAPKPQKPSPEPRLRRRLVTVLSVSIAPEGIIDSFLL